MPYYAEWETTQEFQFETGSPAEINQMMRAAKIDAAPISSMEYLQNPKNYFLFPDFGIASREYVRSVTLFSKKKIEDLKGARIAVTNESLTSVRLLDLLLRERFQIEVQFEVMPPNPKTMLESHDAALLIGDSALLAQPRKWIERYDLGNLWWQWQKMPFVYAVWALRRDAALSQEQIQSFHQTLQNRFLFNLEHLSECIQKHASLDEFDRLYPKVFGYLSNLQYQLGADEWQGFEKFAELCQKWNWCERPNFCFVSEKKFNNLHDCAASVEEKAKA